jgi:hypothetical protein
MQTVSSRLDSFSFTKRCGYNNVRYLTTDSGKLQQKPPLTTDQINWEPSTARISQAVLRDNESLREKRAKWVTKEEIAACRREKRCLRCGRTSYQVEHCPLEPARRPTGTALMNVKKVT